MFNPPRPQNYGYAPGPIRLKLDPEDCAAPTTIWETYLSSCPYGLGLPINIYSSILGVVDWNQDGRNDILTYVSGPNWAIQRATGAGLASPESTNISCSTTTLFLTDSDGDGLIDIGCLNSDGSLTVQLHNDAQETPDLATSFTDGFGVNKTVSYAVSTHDGYTPYTTPVFRKLM